MHFSFLITLGGFQTHKMYHSNSTIRITGPVSIKYYIQWWKGRNVIFIQVFRLSLPMLEVKPLLTKGTWAWKDPAKSSFLKIHSSIKTQLSQFMPWKWTFQVHWFKVLIISIINQNSIHSRCQGMCHISKDTRIQVTLLISTRT